MSFELRPYQKKSIEEIQFYRDNKVLKTLLHMATGGGKTATFCEYIKMENERGGNAMLVVRGVKLIEQASERLHAFGVTHGIMQGQNSRASYLPNQVASIDTLYRRKIIPDCSLLVIDEAHQTTSQGYKWLLENISPSTFILSVSATPHLKKGLRHIADKIVYPISISELIEQGYLVRPRYFSIEIPDLSKVQTVAGEYNERQLGDVMTKSALVGDPVKYWREYADNRPTLMFAVTVEHSKILCEKFNSQFIAAEHIDASSPESARNAAVARLIRGETKILSNVGIFTTGFDCPSVGALILCRPTQSYNLHIQIIGRGTRPHPGKENFIVLDHSGNIHKHGLIEHEQMADLDGTNFKRRLDHKECKFCRAIFPPTASVCPRCGCANEPEERDNTGERNTTHSDGRLVEIDTNMEPWEFEKMRLINLAKQKGLKKGFIFHALKAKFGEETAKKAWESISRMKKWPTKADSPDQFAVTFEEPEFLNQNSKPIV